MSSRRGHCISICFFSGHRQTNRTNFAKICGNRRARISSVLDGAGPEADELIQWIPTPRCYPYRLGRRLPDHAGRCGRTK